jgi:hypothetical protein
MLEYRGIGSARRVLAAVTFCSGRASRVVPTRADGQPAFGLYLADPHASVHRAYCLLVVTTAGDHIAAITRFGTEVLAHFEYRELSPEPIGRLPAPPRGPPEGRARIVAVGGPLRHAVRAGASAAGLQRVERSCDLPLRFRCAAPPADGSCRLRRPDDRGGAGVPWHDRGQPMAKFGYLRFDGLRRSKRYR